MTSAVPSRAGGFPLYEAALFDVDGTLLDTSEFIFQSYEHAFQTHGVPPIPRARLTLMVGRPLEECYEELVPGCDAAVMCATHRNFQVEHPHLSHAYDGIPEMLAALHAKGVRLGAITNRRLTARLTLERAGIDRYLSIVIDGDDVTNHKPHPEPVLKALTAVGVRPDAAVMVGDAPVDIGAGRNAGARTIGVTYGFHGPLIAESNPDDVVDTPAELARLLEATTSAALPREAF